MASFSFKTFTEHLQVMIDTMTANTTQILNFGEGSVLRVIFEAICGRLDYFTIQLKKILLLCRLATSTGSDVDSFIADYGMDARLSAVPSSGTVKFTKKIADINSVSVPVGASVISFDDSVTFTVVADTSHDHYDANLNAYVILAGELTITVPVVAVKAGTVGNVGVNTISIIGSTLPGVDNVTNESAFTNGRDAETDSQVKARFVKFVATRARGTEQALEYAIDIVRSNLIYIVKENINLAGDEQLGHVVVVVDDGTGDPSDELLDSIRASIKNYRAFGIDVDVYPPEVLTTNASLSIQVSSGYNLTQTKAKVSTAITNYLNSQSFGQFLSPERLPSVAFGVAGVIDVNDCRLNSSTDDITPDYYQLVKAGTITVS